ncbi:hypothetical protein J4Q44_G00334810 [Coregonus suidteri]|uniref:Uncharacterized protein n=1 Tax=Coregonus suidteri TaxID=861788 RepID=A0AAN8KQM9_9TELE
MGNTSPASTGTRLLWALISAHQNKVFLSLRWRMEIIVMWLLVDNWPAMSSITSKVFRHIPHQHSREMREKSNIFSHHALWGVWGGHNPPRLSKRAGQPCKWIGSKHSSEEWWT